MPQPTDILFSDFKLNMTAHPVSQDLTRNTNLDAIKQSVKNIILTQHYERPFRPLLGSNVTHYLFENFDPITAENIKEAITEAIENHEPRAELLDVRVHAKPDENGFTVYIIFRGVGQTDPVQLDIFLEQVR